MNRKIVQSHEQLLNSLIDRLSKAHDASDAAAVKKTETDIVVTAATLDMWANALKGTN